MLFAGSGIFNETELTTIFNNGGKSFEHQSELKAGETVAFQEVKGEQRELPVNQEKEEKIKQVSERIEHEHESQYCPRIILPEIPAKVPQYPSMVFILFRPIYPTSIVLHVFLVLFHPSFLIGPSGFRFVNPIVGRC